MKVFRISKLICYVTGAVLVLVFRDFFVENLRWFIGAIMVVYGVLGITGVALEKIRPIYLSHEFLFCSLEILLGATMLALVDTFTVVCVIWAVWSILRESLELREIVEGKLHPVLAAISAVESVAVIVLSIMLIAELSEHHALIHTYLLCVELILSSSIPVLHYMIFDRRKDTKSSEPQAEDARAAGTAEK